MKTKIFFLIAALAFLTNTPSANAKDNTICVTSDRANLRSGPGTNHRKTWEVFQYMPFKKLTTKGDWVFVEDLDKDRHWIHKKLIADNKKCAVVRTEKANLRTGPGTNYPQDKWISSVSKYTAFMVLEVENRWARVKAENGKTYWLATKLLWMN